MRVRIINSLCWMGFLPMLAPGGLTADEGKRNPTPAEQSGVQLDRQAFATSVNRALAFLAAQQADDGSYSRQSGPGITSLVTTAILRHGRSVDDPQVAQALKYLEQFIRPDGGIHQEGSLYRNYETCLAILCFQEANEDGRYDKVLKRANAFIKGLQWGVSDGKDPSDFAYGGAGYGKHRRPDMSNTQFMLDALRSLGEDENSEAIQAALIFVSRCQNLESEHNLSPHAAKVNDGGFYYTVAAGGSSQAGETPNGGLRSYGSMTYAGLKSMIYAGVGPDDPRVKAAVQWLQKHYDLQSNPGMGTSGLYYYYHTFAKALDALGQDVFIDESGQQHSWRAELAGELIRRQNDDGSWLNDNARWLEGDPNLVTSYALMALAYCRTE